MVAQGELYWHDFGRPAGSTPAFLRPCVVVQSDDLNNARNLTTIVCPITSNLRRAGLPGNVLLPAVESGLDQDSVVLVNQPTTVNRELLTSPLGNLQPGRLNEVLDGLATVFGYTR